MAGSTDIANLLFFSGKEMKKPPPLLKTTTFFFILEEVLRIPGDKIYPGTTSFWRTVERLHARRWAAYGRYQRELKQKAEHEKNNANCQLPTY